ncbi:MAG: ABC transporter ATP-binding protein [Gammaproteobacteria bacterium]|nr:ABC transporter ATP-binding protein [Gammaproteobacteria bacterium]
MISVNGLMRNYDDFVAVDQVSFEIKHGEIVGLLGHNGAGKTTLLKMLTGYLEPSSGEIIIDSLDMETKRREIQQKIGYLPENCPVYPEMTIIDYLNYVAELHGVKKAERDQIVYRAIERTALQEKACQAIATLSRGFRQRVGVAQAILHEPEILILDEPTNGLDPSQIQHMRELIKELAKKATVIISTHIMQEVQAVCDRVIILRRGQKVLDAKLAELQKAQRLLVTVDAKPEDFATVTTGIAAISSVNHLNENRSLHYYALQLDDQAPNDQVAPQVAKQIVNKGYQLHALHQEQRDLERVFKEINTPQGEQPHE